MQAFSFSVTFSHVIILYCERRTVAGDTSFITITAGSFTMTNVDISKRHHQNSIVSLSSE